jgi:hypothetical protein
MPNKVSASFIKKRFNYLGNIISVDGIAVDPEKVEAIRGWSVLRNLIGVISFMGLFCYYKIFRKGFSNIAIQITSLQNKGVQF